MNSDLEKLERLEQSITQLLYEIDSNFSKCHRIITTNILPVVEQYAENSREVWNNSKFWKQFFEASANVSLSGYEEHSEPDGDHSSNTTREHTKRRDEDSFMNSLDENGIGQSTPKPRKYTSLPDTPLAVHTADARTATQALEADATPIHESIEIGSSPVAPPTPQTILRDDLATPSSTPVHVTPSALKSGNRKAGVNPLLHRVLDSNWKLQATPHSNMARNRLLEGHLNRADRDGTSTSPTSSPPQLTTVLPRSGSHMAVTPRPRLAPKEEYYDSDDDSSIGGMSPPVTMQFSMAPSKLLRTPAREAAKHMVDEILRTAGANDLSTIPSERGGGLGFMTGTGNAGNGTGTMGTGATTQRRLFGGEESTPLVHGKERGMLDDWQESDNWDI